MTRKQNGRVEELHAALEAGVANLTSGAEWQAWLDVQSRFHRYSMNNTLLIMLQRPDATQVAGYRAWQALGRQVRKGEKSIGILAPMIVKERDDNGQESSRVRGFRCVSVFDISQTEGDPLPERPRPTLLEGEAPAGLWDGLAALVAAEGYALERGQCDGANGITVPAQRVVRVRDDVSDAQAVKTLAHELAHVLLHADGEGALTHRGVAEVEAESVAYLVTGAHGMDAAGYTFHYVAGWAGSAEADAVRATGQRVVSTAKKILAGLGTLSDEGQEAA